MSFTQDVCGELRLQHFQPQDDGLRLCHKVLHCSSSAVSEAAGVQGQGLSSAWSLNFTRLMNSWSVALCILSTVWPPAANPPSSWLLRCSRRAAASTTAVLWCPPLVASCSPGFCLGSVLLQPGQQLGRGGGVGRGSGMGWLFWVEWER